MKRKEFVTILTGINRFIQKVRRAKNRLLHRHNIYIICNARPKTNIDKKFYN
jgi:Lhr-like helicase